MSDNQSLRKKTIAGALWKFGERASAQIVNFIVGIILARLLMPEDYGIIALVLNFIFVRDERKQQQAAQRIHALGLSVRQAELLCKNMTRQPAPQPKVTLAVDYIGECEKSLSKQLGRGVKIINGKRKGKFELEFYGEEDLQNLLDALMRLK